MYDVVIIGAGPAGISAGLYAKRAGANVLILYSKKANVENASAIENYYGFVDKIDGKILYENGIKQAQNIGIDIRQEEVVSIENIDEFKITTINNTYEAKSIIIATGNKKLKPNINGITTFEGRGISYCAICDGFFYRNKNVVVIGNGKFAIHEADELKNIVSNVKILTNGLEINSDSEYEIINKKIIKINGNEKVESIEFEDGSKIEIDGIFIALGEAGGSDFAKKLGIIQKEEKIVVDENMMTNVNGIFACGDITGGLLQISKAVYEGAKAGISAANYIKGEK